MKWHEPFQYLALAAFIMLICYLGFGIFCLIDITFRWIESLKYHHQLMIGGCFMATLISGIVIGVYSYMVDCRHG